MRNELWCVVVSGSDGYIYAPYFFKTEEEAVAFINQDANKSYGQSLDYEDTNIRISNDGMKAKVWADETSLCWEAFDVTHEIEGLCEEENEYEG